VRKVSNKIKYSLDDFEQLQNYIQGIKIREYFFKGYKKTRYIAHDRIHHWVAQSLNLEQPTVTNLLYNYIGLWINSVPTRLFHSLVTK